MVKHVGGCHCGKVRFEVEAPAEIKAKMDLGRIGQILIAGALLRRPRCTEE